MGALITRPSSGDGAPTLKLSEKIMFKVSRGASSIYSTLLSLLRRDAPSQELLQLFDGAPSSSNTQLPEGLQ